MSNQTKTKPTWLEVEKAIHQEIFWLKNNILPYLQDKNLLNYSDVALYKLIATLIVFGKIKATEFSYSQNKLFDKIQLEKIDKKHGSDWHDEMICYLANYFQDRDYKIDKKEPKLYYGQADLKIEKNNQIIYFEIDTLNIFKLYINLMIMREIKLIIITNNKIIKFEL